MDLASLGLTIDGRGAIRTLREFTGSAHNAGKATEKFERSTKNLTAALGGLGAYFGIRQLVEYADTWTLINARVNLVTRTHEQAIAVQTRLFRIAQQTRNTLAATSVLYTRTALNADQLGRSHEELLRMVEAVNSAMLLSGATGVESAQAMRQLAQALGAGRLQGDEFRTVMEAMPMVARAIADEMGVALGELYKLSREGKISVQVIIDALLKAHQELTEAAENMPWTIGQALEYFRNEATMMVGVINMGIGASMRIGDAIKWVADNLDHLIAGVGGVAAAFISYRVAALGALAVTKLLTAAQTIGAFLSLAKGVRSVADAMALLSLVGKGAVGVLIAATGAVIGWKAYQTILAQINAETAKWNENLANLDETLGTATTTVDEGALKRRHEIADMLREAAQQVVLAGTLGDAEERLAIQFDATNKRIEARRELSGDALDAMIAAINTEEEWLLEAQRLRSEIEAANEVIEEHFAILDRFAENVQRSLGDVFYDVMNEGIARFSDLFDAIKQMFFRLVADMAAAAFMEEFGEDIKNALQNMMQGSTDRVAAASRQIEAAQKQAGGFMGPATTGDKPLVTKIDEIKGTVVDKWAQTVAKVLGPAIAGFMIGSAIGSQMSTGTSAVLGGALGGAATGFMMGGPLGAAIGGLTGAVGGLLGWSKSEAEERRRQREVLRQNNARLQQLRDTLEGTTLAGRLGPAQQALQQYMQMREEGMNIIEFLRAYPLRETIREMADELGIDLSAKGAYEQLAEAIELASRALTEFGNNLQDWTLRLEAYNKLFDIEETPQQMLQDTYRILNEMAPQLMEQLGLTGLDLTTEAGRQMLLEGLREIYRMIVSGDLTPDLLGAFTDKNQLIDAILRTKDALDEFHQQLYDVTTDFPRAMDIIYYEQKYGRYGMGDLTPVDALIEEKVPSFQVNGGITIVVRDTDTGRSILDKMEKAASRRTGRGGRVELESEDGW